MRRVLIDLLEVGMVLAESVYNQQQTLELLPAGTVIKENYIRLMEQNGVFDVLVASSVAEYEQSSEQGLTDDHALASESPLETTLAHAIEEAGTLDYKEVVASVCNRNMQIQLLTGEGNIPIDEVHAQAVAITRGAFDDIRRGGPVDRVVLEAQVNEMLPDMIRNNDVLMRLNQLKASDDYLFDHSLRVSMLASIIGKWMGYSIEQLKDLALAGLLFDVGKLSLPEAILLKPGPLSAAEFEIAQKHAQLGYMTLLKTPGISQDVKFAALQHHERLDGSGYPLRVKAGQIHEYSKIIMVCDIFDAMIQDRVYRKKVSPFQAAEYIAWHSGTTLDARVCYVLLSNLADFYIGKACILNTGEKGRVVYIDVNSPTRPIVQVDKHFIDLAKRKEIYISELE